MITWQLYPKPNAGEWASFEGFTLEARPDGSWSVWGPKGERHSTMLRKENNLEMAKATAEAVAIELSNTEDLRA